MVKKKEVYVVTAPSGTGKTTLNRRLERDIERVEISISLTTRPRRPNEVNGDHYWFVTAEDFDDTVRSGKMLEWAEVFGNKYGTSMGEVERIVKSDRAALLEIDVQGWLKARRDLPEAKSIFIFPPSMQVLWDRLKNRGTDSLEVRKRRINTAVEELKHASDYQYFIINDDLERAYTELKSIVLRDSSSGLSRDEALAHGEALIEEARRASWG